MRIITVLPASPAELIHHWEFVEPQIERALPCASKRFLPVDVLAFCIQNLAQGWFIREEQEIIAVMITRVETYPRQRTLNIFALSGSRMDEWYSDVEAVLVDYAKRQGCTQLECQGRRGWEKVLGIEPRSTVFVKDLCGGTDA
jgi:hypothetical protein